MTKWANVGRSESELLSVSGAALVRTGTAASLMAVINTQASAYMGALDLRCFVTNDKVGQWWNGPWPLATDGLLPYCWLSAPIH